MNKDILSNDLTRAELSACLSVRSNESEKFDWQGYVISFGVGALAGFFLINR
jgi:hypothetical protein